MNLIITGSSGRLGSELMKLSLDGYKVRGWTRNDADLLDFVSVCKLFLLNKPDVVIHTAAMTDTVKCEQNKQESWDNNVLSTLNIVKCCASSGAKLVFLSTDFVFSGEEPEHPIPISTRPDPINYYGLCKTVAETVVQTLPDFCVLRCTMKERIPWKHDSAPSDTWISHSYYDEIAQVVQQIVLNNVRGIVHFGARDVNLYEFAKESKPEVRQISRHDIRSMRIPGDVRLSC